MTEFYRALVTAFQFLTRLPMPTLADYQPQDSGRAFPLFPLVGLTIGVILTSSALFLDSLLPASVIAGIVLMLWILLTGGLHLDGLGDSADGWLAGGDRERSLSIMKDPHSGSAAVIIIGASLLIKFSLLAHLIENHQWWALALAPMVARAFALLLFLTTPYVSPEGIADQFLQHTNRLYLRVSVASALIITLVILGSSAGLWSLALSFAMLLGLRRLMMKRLQGTTGDTSGALIEWVEMCFLTGCLISLS